MEEAENTEFLGKDVGEYLKAMCHRVKCNNHVIGCVNGIRITMFNEEKCVDHHRHDGPR